MTRDEYKMLVLESAGEGGRIDPPRLTSWFLMHEILVEMETAMNDEAAHVIRAMQEGKWIPE